MLFNGHAHLQDEHQDLKMTFYSAPKTRSACLAAWLTTLFRKWPTLSASLSRHLSQSPRYSVRRFLTRCKKTGLATQIKVLQESNMKKRESSLCYARPAHNLLGNTTLLLKLGLGKDPVVLHWSRHNASPQRDKEEVEARICAKRYSANNEDPGSNWGLEPCMACKLHLILGAHTTTNISLERPPFSAPRIGNNARKAITDKS